MKVLEECNIPYIFQDEINDGSKRRYDISCIYKDKKVIFEFDGKQHFEYVSLFHKDSIEDFENRRIIDKIKFLQAIKDKNVRFIRIYNDMIKDLDKFKKFILDSLDSEIQVIFSHPEKYEWIYE